MGGRISCLQNERRNFYPHYCCSWNQAPWWIVPWTYREEALLKLICQIWEFLDGGSHVPVCWRYWWRNVCERKLWLCAGLCLGHKVTVLFFLMFHFVLPLAPKIEPFCTTLCCFCDDDSCGFQNGRLLAFQCLILPLNKCCSFTYSVPSATALI
jgi:hypothetical protein